MGDETQPLELQLGPGELARQYHARFGRPVLFAETGAPGDDATMIAWLERVVDATRSARESGVPVIGITWWGLIDQVDWGSGLRRHDYQIDPTGLQSLQWKAIAWSGFRPGRCQSGPGLSSSRSRRPSAAWPPRRATTRRCGEAVPAGVA